MKRYISTEMTFVTHCSALSDSCHIERRGMGKIKNKWDNLDERVQKWASRLGAIATIVGVIVAGGGWLIHQVDNAVATRLESQTSAIQDEVQKLSEAVEAQDKEQEQRLMRLELMTLMDTDPDNVLGIEKLAKEYFSERINGNSYMTAYYTRWAKQYGGDLSVVLK